MMFTEFDFIERFKLAKDHGFGAIEIQFPYEFPAEDLLEAKEINNLEISVINLDVGDLLTGGPGIAAVPGREDLFK